MIHRVRIKNFKLHKDTDLPLRKVSMFIGPNGSGKSSIGQILSVLRQASDGGGGAFFNMTHRQQITTEQPFLYPTDYIDIGRIEDVRRSPDHGIDVEIDGECLLPSAQPMLQCELKLAFSIEDIFFMKHHGAIDTNMGKVKWSFDRGGHHESSSLIQGSVSGVFESQPRFPLLRANIVSTSNVATEEFQAAYRLFSDVANAPSLLLQSISGGYAIRGFEESGLPLPTRLPPRIGYSTLTDRSQAIVAHLAQNRGLEDSLNAWFADIGKEWGIRIQCEIKERHQVAVRVIKGGQNRPFLTEGSGVGQIPFLLTHVALTPKGGTVILPEPEAHLHPKAQVNLASFLTRVASEERKQFIIETHSEHVLHGILMAVKKGVLRPDEVGIYYFEAEEDTCKTTRLEVDHMGKVAGGLPGFFEQDVQELWDVLNVSA